MKFTPASNIINADNGVFELIATDFPDFYAFFFGYYYYFIFLQVYLDNFWYTHFKERHQQAELNLIFQRQTHYPFIITLLPRHNNR